MIPRICTVLLTLCNLFDQRLAAWRTSPAPSDDRGQTTAEYALVIVGAAAVAVLLITWATGSGKIGWLLDKMVDTVADMIK